jgi:sugar phosphate isomerase/epimerase
MNLEQFGVDTITFSGPLPAKLEAARAAGFGQVMLNATDVAGDPGGVAAAVAAVRASGLRVTGFQVLRDFEGLSGHLHAYKVDIAQAMLGLCRTLGSKVLLACSSTSGHATADPDILVKDLRKLAMLAMPLGIRVAYEALSWARHVNLYPQAWELVQAADRANLGLAIDSYHILAHGTPLDTLREIDPVKIVLVQLSDFLWHEVRSREDRIETARHYRVFPGEGVHGEQVMELVRTLDDVGYRGDYSFEVFNDDYRQLPPDVVAGRARRSVEWIASGIPRRNFPPLRPQPASRSGQ